jgi:phosphodiesterase/alkaline phosphatase D-like protein
VAGLKTEAPTGITRTSATLNGSFTGNGSSASYYFKWALNPDFLTNSSPSSPADLGTPSGHTPVAVGLSGLQPQSTYYYRVVVTNSAGTSEGLLRSFTTQQYVIDTTTKPATGLSQDGVTLNGEFFGTGESVEYHFEWGPTAAYGNKAPETPVDAGAASGPTPVSVQLTDFEGSTTYHYRLVATNSLGISYGADETFTALVAPLPGIENSAVSSVGAQDATFEAEITPNRKATIYLFEYGPSTDYGSFTAVGDPIPGIPNEGKSVSTGVDGLTPGTVYHYRAVATNFSGTSYGPDRTFRTAGQPEIDLVSVSSVAPTSATVSALVRPNLRETTVQFDYGTTDSYGSRLAASGSVGGDEGQHSSTATLSGLLPETTYHFRAVATNELGATVSTEQTFRTPKAQAEQPPSATGKKCKRGFVKRQGRCVKKRRHRHHRKRASGQGQG